MTILREISEARINFYQQHGSFPSRLIVCPETLHEIKAELYHNSPIVPAAIPLRSYDLMPIQVNSQNPGWSLA